MTDGRVPAWQYLRSLLRRPPRVEGRLQRRLAKILTISDMRVVARRRVPLPVFDYVDGGADEEVTLTECRSLYASIRFRPAVLRDVSGVDTSTMVLGKPMSLPFAFAPTGFTRMMHPDGETAVARSAQRAGIAYALSTVGTTSIEQLAAVAPTCRRWFQLYVSPDRDLSRGLIDRAAAAGYEALIVTVDAPVLGRRLRDMRNGFSTPPSLTLRTMAGVAARPAWLVNFMRAEPLSFESVRASAGGVPDYSGLHFDAALSYADIEWIRGIWSGPLVVKGVQSEADAEALANLGVNAIVLSNHGGRQLDRSLPPLRLVRAAREATKGLAEVWVDGGVMSGSDVVAALALGAHCVLVGRAYLYGLMAGGEEGVDRSVAILSSEVRRTMQLLGARSVAELNEGLVVLPTS
ncbi:MAG: alpha-hydroxy acid oxidase [Acidimicrobiales bacterium]